jgi:hypothetical protein
MKLGNVDVPGAGELTIILVFAVVGFVATTATINAYRKRK